MDTTEWAVKKINKWQKDSDKLSHVVHSRCESIRQAARDMGKDNVVELAREAKAKFREGYKLLERLPTNLGQALTQEGEVALAPIEQELPLGEEAPAA